MYYALFITGFLDTSKRELMPTLKALRVRLKNRLFLLPLKSFCKQKSFGDTPFFSVQLVCVFLSYRPNAVSGAYPVIRSSVLYSSGFLDCAINCSARNDMVVQARNDIVLNTLLNFTKRFALQRFLGKRSNRICVLPFTTVNG